MTPVGGGAYHRGERRGAELLLERRGVPGDVQSSAVIEQVLCRDG